MLSHIDFESLYIPTNPGSICKQSQETLKTVGYITVLASFLHML